MNKVPNQIICHKINKKVIIKTILFKKITVTFLKNNKNQLNKQKKVFRKKINWIKIIQKISNLKKKSMIRRKIIFRTVYKMEIMKFKLKIIKSIKIK